jgi:Response regulator containing CheY-like receiver, AAA-type ATPase, and DNA-binding domains
VLEQIKNYDPNINVIIVSAQEKIDTAVSLLKAGAFDYITKDHETKDRLLNAIRHARNKSSLIREIHHLKKRDRRKIRVWKKHYRLQPGHKESLRIIGKGMHHQHIGIAFG